MLITSTTSSSPFPPPDLGGATASTLNGAGFRSCGGLGWAWLGFWKHREGWTLAIGVISRGLATAWPICAKGRWLNGGGGDDGTATTGWMIGVLTLGIEGPVGSGNLCPTLSWSPEASIVSSLWWWWWQCGGRFMARRYGVEAQKWQRLWPLQIKG